jgi:hypothetical protein
MRLKELAVFSFKVVVASQTRESGHVMMFRFVLVSVAAIALALVAGQSVAAGEKSHDGKIVKAGDGKLTMTDKAGQNKHTHDVATDAKITCDGKEVKLADLKAGDAVTVTTKTDDKDTTLAIKIEARFAAEKSHEGKIVKAGAGKLVMTDAEGDNKRTVNVADEATITCEGKDVKLAELKEGDFVKVTTKTDDKDVTLVTKIEARAKEIGGGS